MSDGFRQRMRGVQSRSPGVWYVDVQRIFFKAGEAPRPVRLEHTTHAYCPWCRKHYEQPRRSP